MRNIIIILFSLIISSCATTRWVSDIKPQNAFDIDYAHCKYWAFEKFPPNVQYVTRTDYYMVDDYDPYLYHSRYYYRPRYYYAPLTRIDTQDINEEARQSAINSCMIQNGWRQETTR